MKRIAVGLAVFVLFLAGHAELKAGALLYDNGPINGTMNAWNVSFYTVTDSFTLSNPATLGSARVGLWALPGDIPSSTTWSIGTAPFAADISAGLSAMSSVFTGLFGFGSFPIYESTFDISGTLAAGTYWLSLTNTTVNANPSPTDSVYWDQNNGPSTAYQTTTGQLPGSNSFQIYGPNTIPEPASMTLLAIGAIGLAGYGLRRRKQS